MDQNNSELGHFLHRANVQCLEKLTQKRNAIAKNYALILLPFLD